MKRVVDIQCIKIDWTGFPISILYDEFFSRRDFYGTTIKQDDTLAGNRFGVNAVSLDINIRLSSLICNFVS